MSVRLALAQSIKATLTLLEADALPQEVIAYNGGKAWVGDKPDLSYVGTGESSQPGAYLGNILGPGIYFATEKDVAERYLKYGGNRPTLHKVSIDTEGLYETRTATPIWLRNSLNTAFEELISKDEFKSKVRYRDDGSRMDVKGYSLGKHGQGVPGQVFALLGAEEGRKFLLKVGITGVFEKLAVGGYEIAVFDPSIVTLLEKIPFYNEDEALEKDKKDEVASHQTSIDMWGSTSYEELDDWDRKYLTDAIEFFKKNPSLLRPLSADEVAFFNKYPHLKQGFSLTRPDSHK